MSENSVFSKLLDNTPVALLLIGVVMLVVGAAGGWDLISIQVQEPVGQVVLIVAGAIIAMVGLVLLLRGRSTDAQKLDVQQYGIRIVSPSNGDLVGEKTKVSGASEKPLPAPYQLMLYTYWAGNKRSWPQSKAVFDEKNNWHGEVTISPGTEGEIVVAIVGKEAQAVCDYSLKVGQESGWPGIETLTSDVFEADRIRVICLGQWSEICGTSAKCYFYAP